ncbi:hypothetical protein HELRODRAFT_182868 [Helobdella robusta]|uniref:RING-type domain-containing protein n=1 Tax=Helobdella robusta TaxID=6412 RepID=T1FIW3_HELRO|nr:hypothetical protein HELRODRAFT_182868 [Helobdella robusta]ESN90076.1 hypothetical protein HELRODRAFT_182868 [Helobdella robusta]
MSNSLETVLALFEKQLQCYKERVWEGVLNFKPCWFEKITKEKIGESRDVTDDQLGVVLCLFHSKLERITEEEESLLIRHFISVEKFYELFIKIHDFFYDQYSRKDLVKENLNFFVGIDKETQHGRIIHKDTYLEALANNRHYRLPYLKNKFSDDKCTICREQFEEHSFVHRTKCSHAFHTDCIEKWLKVQTTCPNCYQILVVSANLKTEGYWVVQDSSVEMWISIDTEPRYLMRSNE